MLRIVVLALCTGALFGADPFLIVLHKGGSSLGFYTPEGTHLSSVPVGQHPHEFALGDGGRLAYITDNGTLAIEQAGTGGNTVSIIDLAARRKAGQISLGNFRRPHGIDLDEKAGLLAVTTELPDQLLLINTRTREIVKRFDPQGKTAHMVKLGPGARWAYVSNSSSANVAAVELATGNVKRIPTAARPEGSVLSPDGRRLYVVNREANRITIIDTAKNEAVGDIRTGDGPVRIGITPDGKQLVYAVMRDNAVEFAETSSGKVVGKVGIGGQPVSLHVSGDGKLAFTCAQEMDTCWVVSVPDRKVVRQFKTAKGMLPDPALLVTPR
jgi:YVTN family beta-propeller protein